MNEVEQKTFLCCEHIINTGATIRETAKEFNICKSSVHAYLHKFMPEINEEMYKQVCVILEKHFKESERLYNL